MKISTYGKLVYKFQLKKDYYAASFPHTIFFSSDKGH